jgi:hypothetical protein
MTTFRSDATLARAAMNTGAWPPYSLDSTLFIL